MYQTSKKFESLFGRDDIVVLGIESSCDETAAAITRGNAVLCDCIASQIEIHKRFGGVVPEIASRNHTLMILNVIEKALKESKLSLDDIDAVAVTSHPGLIGSLLVGVSTAKAISFAKNIPLIDVNHIEAHICANYANGFDLKPPFIALVASGGHTGIIDVRGYNEYIPVAHTSDDAIGEAFDKVARVLGLPYPGGPNIDKLALKGNPCISFIKRRNAIKDLSISYSGLKTAVVNYVHNLKQKNQELNIEDICASFTRDAVDLLVAMVIDRAKAEKRQTIVLAGGVSANTYLRQKLLEEAGNGFRVIIPPMHLCTDNASMVALRGYYSAKEGKNLAHLDLNAKSV